MSRFCDIIHDLSKFSHARLAEFSLIDYSGDTVGADTQGLLISNGGTVCDDSFSDNSADAICREMGHYGHTSWTSGSKWNIQSDLDIKLDDVVCSSGKWSDCRYSTTHNCGHIEDIFLNCHAFGKLPWSRHLDDCAS